MLERGAPGSAVGVGLVLAVLAVATEVDHAIPRVHLAVGLGLATCLLVIARANGLTAADLGLARSGWRSGLRWGAAAAALVAATYALAYLVAPVREVLPGGDGDVGRVALTTALVLVPLGTVLPEELAFRGLLLPLLGRRHGLRVATLLSSALFGGAANAAMAGGVGGDAAGTVARVVVTVLFTSLAGVVLCWLRLRSDSLLAPMLAHWTVNGLGAIVALVA